MTNLIKHSYNGAIISQESDGYVSLTDMAKIHKKLVADYLRTDNTKAYLEALSMDMGIPISALVNTLKGGKGKQGTWAHPEVAIDFAQWCSPTFKVWANRVLRGVITQAKPDTKKAIAYYSDRVADLPQRLSCPDGYWAVIEECGYLLLEVERAGYPVNRFDLLDGSVGKHWANHRRSLGLPESTAIARYRLDHKPSAPIPITVYPFSEMGVFKQWLKEVYMKTLMPKYLQDKYGKLVKIK